MLKIGCFSGRIQNVPKSVGGTLGPDGKMWTGEATTNSYRGSIGPKSNKGLIACPFLSAIAFKNRSPFPRNSSL